MAGPSVVGVIAGNGRTVPGTAGNVSLMASLTPDEIREIREYEKLLRFRDEVVAGSHPRIKPTHLPGKVAQSPNQPTASAAAVPAPPQPVAAKKAVNNNRPVIDNFQSHQANQQVAQVNMASSLPGLSTLPSASGGRSLGPGKTAINPVLLEKSDDLIKAEIQLQRQRLERSLKDQLEQRRGANKASEQLAELDVSDIMAKALSLTLATPLVQATDETAANGSASSDSFDDNTFYSSRHDTPESHMVSRLPNESEDEGMREVSPYEPELDSEPVVQPAKRPSQGIPTSAPSQHQQKPNVAPVQIPGVAVPGLHIGTTGFTRAYNQPRLPEAAGALQTSSGSRSDESGSTGNGPSSGTHELSRVNERLLNQALARPASPRVYGHDLSPLAPQPTHVIPSTITRQPQLVESSRGPQAAPAQVAALRKQTSNASSPDSSPQGNRAAEKKKSKKKKRKADRLAAEPAAASPYIKPEPRSPSPLTPQYARPHKRQRQSQQQPLEIEDDEPRYERRPIPIEDGYQERYQPRVVRQERVVGYERADEYHLRHGDEPVMLTSPRYERVYYDDYRVPPPSGHATRPESAQYVSREVRAVRPAPRVVEGYEDGGATYYRDARAPSRMSVRPAAYPERSASPIMYERPPTAMAPPKAPPRRIIVDSFGREYLEPIRPATVMREEVVSDLRSPYERVLPPRALSRRPEPLDDDAVLYHPTSPVYTAPRRVVTQPEYAYRSPGTSTMPPPSATEYFPSRPELPREYLTRASTARPLPPPSPMESTRYDEAPLSYERLERINAALLGDYYRAPSAHPTAADGGRYEAPPAAYEPLSARDYPPPMQQPPPLRSASVRPAAEQRYGGDLQREYIRRDIPAGLRTEYAAASPTAQTPVYQQDVRREAMPPPLLPPSSSAQGRAYSAVPAGEEARRREYAATQQQGYYGLPPPFSVAPERREDEEVVFLDRMPREGYREMR